MELVHVHIYKSEFLNNIGINLSDEYEIKYEIKDNFKSYEFHIEKSKSFKETFWGTKISSLNAIVGANGSGKTTLLRFIMNFFDSPNRNESGFFIFLDRATTKDTKDNFFVICNNMSGIGFILKNSDWYNISCYASIYDYPELLTPFNSLNQSKILLANKIIYINSNLDNKDYKSQYPWPSSIIDLSTGYLINNYLKFDSSKGRVAQEYDKIAYFFSKEIYNQFNFISICKKNSFNLPFKAPKRLKISINNSSSIHYISNIDKHADEKSIDVEKIDYPSTHSKLAYIFGDVFLHHQRDECKKRTDKDKRFIVLIESIVQAAIRSIFPIEGSNVKTREYIYILKTLQKLSLDENDSIKTVIEKYIAFIKNADESINNKYELFKKYVDFLEWLSINEVPMLSYIADNGTYYFDIGTEDTHGKFLSELLDHYSKVSDSYSFLDFSWGLSSGEFTLLSLYSRLYSKFHEIDDYYKKIKESTEIENFNLVLLMDEPDVTLHPKWQQEYIKSLVDFLPSLYTDCNIKIIITTHSPIMLSDIPKRNVTFIKDGKVYPKEGQMETFGANIHNLFRDSFFMDNTIGTFAYKKINAVIAWLKTIEKQKNEGSYNEDKPKEEDMKKVIDSIGEPLIRNKLTKMYNDIFREKLGLDAQIRQYKDDILKLQNYIKNSAAIDKTTLRNLNEDLERTSKQIQNIINKSGDKND